MIPSNVETITRDFFQTLALGNDGQGTTINIESFGARESANSVLVQADSEILANGTIKYAFNLQRKLRAKQHALLHEIRTFNKHLLDSFYRDYMRIKARRQSQ